MLVLTRKPGQKIIIDDHIEITVLESRGDSIKIGIQAPRSVSIYREEVLADIRLANQQANEQTKTKSHKSGLEHALKVFQANKSTATLAHSQNLTLKNDSPS